MKVDDNRSLKIMHFAMCIGLMMMLLVFVLFAKEDGFSFQISTTPDLYLILGAVLALYGVLVSQIVFNNMMGETFSNEKDPAEKLRAAYVFRWALLEGPGLVNVVFFILSDNFMNVFLALFMWCMMLLARPQLL